VFDSGNKRVIVTEITDKQRVDVEVFELHEDSEPQPYEKIFEGHYRNGKSSEQRKYLMSIDVPSPVKSRTFPNRHGMSHHQLSFDFGFAGFADKGDPDEIHFQKGRSPEIGIYMYNKALSLSPGDQVRLV
jgi:hypothetical protein